MTSREKKMTVRRFKSLVFQGDKACVSRESQITADGQTTYPVWVGNMVRRVSKVTRVMLGSDL